MNPRDYETLLKQADERCKSATEMYESALDELLEERKLFRGLAAKQSATFEAIEDWHESQRVFEEDHPLWLIIRINGWESYFPLKPDTFGT